MNPSERLVKRTCRHKRGRFCTDCCMLKYTSQFESDDCVDLCQSEYQHSGTTSFKNTVVNADHVAPLHLSKQSCTSQPLKAVVFTRFTSLNAVGAESDFSQHPLYL